MQNVVPAQCEIDIHFIDTAVAKFRNTLSRYVAERTEKCGYREEARMATVDDMMEES